MQKEVACKCCSLTSNAKIWGAMLKPRDISYERGERAKAPSMIVELVDDFCTDDHLCVLEHLDGGDAFDDARVDAILRRRQRVW